MGGVVATLSGMQPQEASRSHRSAGESYAISIAPYSAEHPRNDHAQIFPLANGRLLVVWSEYYANSPETASGNAYTQRRSRDDAPCRLTGRVSDDRGRTWGPRFTVQDNTGVSNVKQPNLLRTASGSILLFFTRWDFERHERTIFYKHSNDEAETWSVPEPLHTPGGVYVLDSGRVFTMASGRIILPTYWTPEVWSDKDHLQAFCYYSDDEGVSWRESSNRMDLPGRGAMEPGVVESTDGRLLVILRSDQGYLYQAESPDGGESWSTPTRTDLESAQSEPCLRRMPGGELLLIWNNTLPYAFTRGGRITHHPRNPLTAAISRDEGRTWEGAQDIENRIGYSSAYPNAFFHNGEALITYYHGSEAASGTCSLELRIFTLEQLLGTASD